MRFLKDLTPGVKKSFLLMLSFCFVFLFSVPGIIPVSADDQLSCKQVSVPVHLSATDSTEYHIAGSLCSRGSLVGKTVQILVHGATYDHNYWDFPYESDTYSYVQKATSAGFATLNIDRIGIGQSSHPDPNLVTTEANAYVLHQLVQGLRNGTIGKTSFHKVILVGHSLGSGASMLEASTYQDVNGVIVTGLLHQVAPETNTVFMASLYPANLDPKFSSAGLPDGYLTTLPDSRAKSFYNTSFADPKVIALDEQLKQTFTMGEVNTFANSLAPEVSQKINVPVLLVMGQDDILFCNADLPCTSNDQLKQRESSYFNSNAKLKAIVVPKDGHDLNLHPNAGIWYKEAINWAKSI